MKEQKKKKYTIKALFLPMEIRKALHVKDNDLVEIIEENGQYVLKNRIQNALDEIGALMDEDYTKLGVITDEDAIQYMINRRHGNT